MLTKVTITGADDSTSLKELAALSQEFPFVEWGILVSKRQEGGARFPSRDWIDRFTEHARAGAWNVSTHVCGTWVRQMFVGELHWDDIPSVFGVAQRIQINTHAERHLSTTGLVQCLADAQDKQFIFQWDGLNNHLTYAALAYGFNVAALFDTSGGAGILPGSWPLPDLKFPCGYAGGLGPDNVQEQLTKIEAVCKVDYWIDMERRVRVENDRSLDMRKVERVLQICAKHIAGE